MPELFLPTFQQISSPELIDFKPPPRILIDDTLGKLQSFMDWLLYHPLLKRHDFVLSFVRSSSDVEKSSLLDNSFSRRQLLLEKMNDTPLSNNNMMNSKDEEYFLKYTEDLLMPLKTHFLSLLINCIKFIYSGLELEKGFELFSRSIFEASSQQLDMFSSNPLALETIYVCSNVIFEKNYVSPWSEFMKVCRMLYTIMDGILLSLQRPFTLIKQRHVIKESIEVQKELLGKSKGWHDIFSTNDRKRQIELDKDKIIKKINELNSLDSQIQQSHKIISDELAHFQDIHPKIMIKAIRRLVKSTLRMEKNKLHVLSQTLTKWEKPLPSLPI
ncbi:uncharacterized protein BX663DRAFT_489031 [Cokeromyces recurvatus]|uniref:uncharacterized protein n=1 Tax=Cokeromyces recurvatus TaxID=90255 RepID=UPI002220B3B1|nr:uncharacterized protein BX663DRAFT_489031 [Cokeromyces recurvatus]KAI7899576.1 hypothetical protein BX663DRAFT_489031 [Cokeromyces recurvatus]